MPRRCRQCPACKRAAKAKHIARIINGFDGQNYFVHLTLTSVPSATWPLIMTGFTRLVSHLRKSQPALQYVAVKEEGADTGMKHLHVIFHSWVWHNYDDIVAHWQRLTGASGVYIKRKPNTMIAGYAAKYVGKGMVNARRIVTYSAHWPKLPKDNTWRVVGYETLPTFTPPTSLEDANGWLLENYPPSCYDVIDVQIMHLETYSWLRSIQVRSWRQHPAPSAS